jgi:hypothetical protein
VSSHQGGYWAPRAFYGGWKPSRGRMIIADLILTNCLSVHVKN